MDDGKKLLEILSNYIQGTLSVDEFCDSFTIYFNQETDYDTLSKLEDSLYGELCDIADRFSPFEEELKKYKYYYSSEEVWIKAKEVWDILTNGNRESN